MDLIECDADEDDNHNKLTNKNTHDTIAEKVVNDDSSTKMERAAKLKTARRAGPSIGDFEPATLPRRETSHAYTTTTMKNINDEEESNVSEEETSDSSSSVKTTHSTQRSSGDKKNSRNGEHNEKIRYLGTSTGTVSATSASTETSDSMDRNHTTSKSQSELVSTESESQLSSQNELVSPPSLRIQNHFIAPGAVQVTTNTHTATTTLTRNRPPPRLPQPGNSDIEVTSSFISEEAMTLRRISQASYSQIGLLIEATPVVANDEPEEDRRSRQSIVNYIFHNKSGVSRMSSIFVARASSISKVRLSRKPKVWCVIITLLSILIITIVGLTLGLLRVKKQREHHHDDQQS